MARPQKLALPMRDGVSASCVALPTGPWALLIDFLVERMPQISHAVWLARLQGGLVLDETGQALRPDARFCPGQRVYYYRQIVAEPVIPFEASILFQDDLLLVVDKPHFLPVTPVGRYVQQTLLTRLKQATGLAHLTPLHRIDRETSGLVLFGLQPQTRAAYQALFRLREVEKTYEAIAAFKPGLALPLTRNSRLQQSDVSFMQMVEVAGEPNAQTRISLLEQSGHEALYLLQPLTGQRHQLRVHMSALGLPIRGDRIYPTLWPEPALPDYSAPLQLLACGLSFIDPVTQQARRFELGRKLAF